MRRRHPADVAAGRVVVAAALPVLEPLGLKQRGKSRVFIADEHFWLLVVEFPPGNGQASAKIGAHFLWFEQPSWCFDHGRRVEGAASYRDDAQFMPVADALVRSAADAAETQRQTFASIAAIARTLAANPDDGFWPLYHKGVALGLAGDASAAADALRRIGEKSASDDWQREVQVAAATLVRCLPDHTAFRAAVTDVVARTRTLQGFAPLAAIFD